MRYAVRLSFMFLAVALSLGTVAPAILAAQDQQDQDEATPVVEEEEEASGPRFILRPIDGVDGDYVDIEAEPGSTQTLTVVFANADEEEAVELRTYPADAVSRINGGFGVLSEEDAQSEPTTWLDHEAQDVDLAAGEAIEHTITVTVPEDAAPGEYIAGIALQTADPLDVEGTTLFNQVIRKVIAVFIRVPGPAEAEFSLGEPAFDVGPAATSLLIPVDNTGDLWVRPEGTATLTDENDTPVLNAPVEMGAVYAGHETALQIPVPRQFEPGDYTLELDLEDPNRDASASLDTTTVTLEDSDAQVEGVSISEAAVTPVETDDTVQFADVSVTLDNAGSNIAGSQLTLNVERDGELVEDFVLADSLALPSGETTVSQRYIPDTGWESGEYTFSLTLTEVDAASGGETQLLTEELDEPLLVP